MINSQLQVRNVVIENLSTNNIMARVSFQKSAISSSKTHDKDTKSRGIGVGMNVEASTPLPGIGASIGGNLNVNSAKSKEELAEYEMKVTAFKEEGWISVKSGKSKQFAVQGQIAYISITDEDDNILVENQTSAENQLIWDGEDLDEMKRWEKANKGGRKKMAKLRKESEQIKAQQVQIQMVSQQVEQVEQAKKTPITSIFKNTVQPKNTAPAQQQQVVYVQPQVKDSKSSSKNKIIMAGGCCCIIVVVIIIIIIAVSSGSSGSDGWDSDSGW